LPQVGEGTNANSNLFDESEWPAVDAIVGNPPFLGDKKMRGELGDDYTEALRRVYAERVPGGADLVTYWFEKARAHIAAGQCQRAGLVSTNSIRGGANQTVLARICASASIFNAWSDEAWINDGAAVRVSLVCFASTNNVHSAPVRPEPVEGSARTVLLNGAPVATIHADLTSGDGLNLTLAKPLQTNAGVAFIGTQKNGAFDIPGELARQWLTQPNPNGRPNSDVIRPWSNGMDITRRPSDTWIIDFGVAMSEQDAAIFELPFQYAEKHIKPVRTGKRHTRASELWWIHECARPGLRNALNSQSKFIGTPRVAKHRLFTWLDTSLLPDCQVVAIARSDDTTFGILHSRFHELWSLGLCTWLGVGNDPRYTPTTTFETFPFPVGRRKNLKSVA
ncbi:MAG: DNA methyltransferase, partial [Gallionella sp.]